MQRALASAIGLPSRSTRALRRLSFLIPAEVVEISCRGFSSELKGTLRLIIDEVKGRPSRVDRGFALGVGMDVYRCVERRRLAVKAESAVCEDRGHASPLIVTADCPVLKPAADMPPKN